MKTTLYDILGDIRAVLDSADDGELPPDAEAALDGLQIAFDDKCDHIARYVQETQAQAAAYAGEAKRLDDLAKAAWAKADRLKGYLKGALEAAGVTRLETQLFRLTLAKNGTPSVRVAEGAEIPDEYRRVKVELNAAKVIEEFRAGWPLPPGIVVEQGSHLRIR